MDRRYDRRQFLRSAAAGTAALSFPVSLPILRAQDDERLRTLPPTTVEKDRTADAPTSPVAIGRGTDFEVPKLAALMATLFDQIGGIRDLVSGKTVTVKLNTTGDGRRGLGGLPAERTYQVHPNMIEVLCGLLTGLGFGVEPTGRHNDGCFMAVFNVAAFRPLAEFKKEVADFARYLKATPPAQGSRGVFYPGEVEHLREVERRKSGIEVEEATWDKLRTIAREHGLAAELGLT